MELGYINWHTYLACVVGIVFGILWQGYEANKKHGKKFRIGIFAAENKWRWAIGALGSIILIKYGLFFLLKEWVGIDSIKGNEDYVDLTALVIGIFGFRIVKLLMKKTTSKLSEIEEKK